MPVTPEFEQYDLYKHECFKCYSTPQKTFVRGAI